MEDQAMKSKIISASLALRSHKHLNKKEKRVSKTTVNNSAAPVKNKIFGHALKYLLTHTLLVTSSLCVIGQTGIGTDDPKGALHIVDNVQPQLIITHTAGEDSCSFSVDSNGTLKIITVDGNGANGHILLNPDGYVGIGTLTPDKLIGIGDGTNEYSISIEGGKLTFWNDASPPAIIFQVDSAGNQIVNADLDVDNGKIKYLKDSVKFIVNADLDVDNGKIKYLKDSVKFIVNADLDVDNGGIYYDKGPRRVGIGTTSPEKSLHIKTTGVIDAIVIIDAATGKKSGLQLNVNGTEMASFAYGNNRTMISAFDGTAKTDRIRMNDGSADILGDGVFTDNAFGPSEWVIGRAESGTVVCMINTRIDEDGKKRLEVQSCTHTNCPNIVGVATPEEDGVHHGNPSFEYMDKLGKGNEWEAKWRENHIGLELTGFRMTKVTGHIKTGDLLVSSGIPGYAMASDEPGMGAILGKAAEDFNGEKGTIWVRVHLQSGSNLYKKVNELVEENTALKAQLTEMEEAVAELEKISNKKMKRSHAKKEIQELKSSIDTIWEAIEKSNKDASNSTAK